MWPSSRAYGNQSTSTNPVQQTARSLDTNQIRMTAESLRNFFADDLNQSRVNSIRDSSANNRVDTSLPQMTSRRPTERLVIDYENQNYSRFDRNMMSSQPMTMSSDFESNNQRFNDSPPLMTENRFYDPTKMPQKSILKKTKDMSFEHNFQSTEEEDLYLYSSAGDLPPGIVSLEQSRRSPPNERPISPISLRLMREKERMERNKQKAGLKEDQLWTPSLGRLDGPSSEDSVRKNQWSDSEDQFARRFRDGINPSPDRSLELEKVRIQQMAAIQAGILTQDERIAKRRDMSPLSSPQRYSDYRLQTYRSSPESSPKRVRRRSPSTSPSRKRSSSPRRRSRSPRRRSKSPRRRSGSPNNRRSRWSRSRSRERYRRSRSRSRTPPRRPNPLDNQMNLMNPMPQMMAIPPPGMPHFLPPPQNLVGVPMGPIMGPMGHFLPAGPMPFRPYLPTMTNAVPTQQINRPSINLKTVPTNAQTSPKNLIAKKDDKLLNPRDLLFIERTKLKDELESLRKQLAKKKAEQDTVAKRDGGKVDSYAYRKLESEVKDLKAVIETKHEKLSKTFELINDVQKSKTKAKQVVEQLKSSGDITKVDIKKKETINKSKDSSKNSKSPDKKSPKEQQKQEKKSETDEDEEDEKSSRFNYFDSGPHWCRDCNRFLDNMKQYFNHIHTKDHMSKAKDQMRQPWITKEYTKQMEKPVVKNKDQLVVASKGIQFILPTHGFFCELCEQFLHDSYQAEKHYKSAKHNRSYTRYTLNHKDYEHKWKSDRDRAYTDLKKKERELEKEKSEKEAEKKIEDRKRLEEEVKRKDREVKERIAAMNKNLKTVKELDDSKSSGEQKKDDKNKSSPKNSIRLNLSSNKSPNKSDEKSKNSDKTTDKSRDKSKEKSVEKLSKSKTTDESMDNSEDIGDMMVIDEINCDDNTLDKSSDEIITGSGSEVLENAENDKKSEKTQEIQTEDKDKTEKNSVLSMDNTVEDVSKRLTEVNNNSLVAEQEIGAQNVDNSNQVEGVMPSVDASQPAISGNDCSIDKTPEELVNSEPITGDKQNDEPNSDKISEINTTEDKTDEKATNDAMVAPEPEECADSRAMTYAEVVAKGSNGIESEDSGQISVKQEYIPPEEPAEPEETETSEKPEDNGSNVLEEHNPVIKTEPLDTNEDLFGIDADIEKFEQQFKKFESLVKNESIDTEPDEDDPLAGFDVIDETNNEDNNQPEDNSKELVK